MNVQSLGRPLGEQGLGGLGCVNRSVVQPQMRWNTGITLGRQGVTPRPEICAAHTPLLEPHADGLEVEVTASDAIEPGARASLHLMGMGLTFGCPRLCCGRVFREAALVPEQNAHKARRFQSQMNLNLAADLLKFLGISFFLGCIGSAENSCPHALKYQIKRNARSSRSWAPALLV